MPVLLVAGNLPKEKGDGVITEEEETRLARLKDALGLSQEHLDRNGALTRLAQNVAVRELLRDKVPRCIEVVGSLPFNLQAEESMVWLFKSVKYYERRTAVRQSGNTVGFGVGIGPVYVGLGQFGGRPIPTTEMVHVDTGSVLVTDHNLYFGGSSQAFRIGYRSIVAFTPFGDGIGVQSDDYLTGSRLFLTGDGWFTYNLIANLARLASMSRPTPPPALRDRLASLVQRFQERGSDSDSHGES